MGVVVLPPLLPGRALDLANNNNNSSNNNNNNNNNNKNTLGVVVLPPLLPGRALDLAKNNNNNNNNNNDMIIVPPRDRSQSSVSRMRRQSRGALVRFERSNFGK